METVVGGALRGMNGPGDALRHEFTSAGLTNIRSLGRRPLTECFIGTHLDTNTEVFVKALHVDVPGVKRNFVQEIEILRSVSGRTGFPAMHAFSKTDGVMFHACERLHSPRLDQLARDSSLGMDDILRLAGALAAWLQRLHTMGYVHRDLSPDHIFAGDRITVVDFGLSKRLDRLDVEVQQRCIAYDVQAFGLIFWEMICGHPVFTYRSPTLAQEIPLQLAVLQSVCLPTHLRRVLTGCLSARSEMSPENTEHKAFISADEIICTLRTV